MNSQRHPPLRTAVLVRCDVSAADLVARRGQRTTPTARARCPTTSHIVSLACCRSMDRTRRRDGTSGTAIASSMTCASISSKRTGGWRISRFRCGGGSQAWRPRLSANGSRAGPVSSKTQQKPAKRPRRRGFSMPFFDATSTATRRAPRNPGRARKGLWARENHQSSGFWGRCQVCSQTRPLLSGTEGPSQKPTRCITRQPTTLSLQTRCAETTHSASWHWPSWIRPCTVVHGPRARRARLTLQCRRRWPTWQVPAAAPTTARSRVRFAQNLGRQMFGRAC